SLPWLNGGQSSLPSPVLVQAPIALPLTTSGKEFTASMTVPVLTPVAEKGSTSLMVPSATNPATLAAGLVNRVPHLYLGDPMNHRVLDLEVPQSPVQGSLTPAPNAAGSTGSSLTLQLAQQYVSPTYLSLVKSLAVDPQGVQLGILSQNSASMVSLITASTGLQ